MSKFEEFQFYKDTLQEAKKYHEDAVGLTTYSGLQGSDKTYPKVLNFQTIMLLELFQKINTIENKLKNIEDRTIGIVTQNDLKKLTDSINIGKEIIPYQTKTSFKSW